MEFALWMLNLTIPSQIKEKVYDDTGETERQAWPW